MSLTSQLQALASTGGEVTFPAGLVRENVVFPATRYPLILRGTAGYTKEDVRAGSAIEALDYNRPAVDASQASNVWLLGFSAFQGPHAIRVGSRTPRENIVLDVQAAGQQAGLGITGSVERIEGKVRTIGGMCGVQHVRDMSDPEDFIDTKGPGLYVDAWNHTGYAVDLDVRVSRSLTLRLSNHGNIPWHNQGTSKGTIRLYGEYYAVNIESYYSEGVCSNGENDIDLGPGVRSLELHQPWVGMAENDGSSKTRYALDASGLSATSAGRRPVHIFGGHRFPVRDALPFKVQFYGGGGYRA